MISMPIDLRDTNDDRQYAPATLRNRDFVLDVLRDFLPMTGVILEIASGPAEHMVNVAMNFRALVFLGSSGLLSRGIEDQPRDFVGMRDQREMAGLHFDGFGAHPLGHEAFEIGIDRSVVR